jgi:putative nucleotidyltransferase with HDIG domain
MGTRRRILFVDDEKEILMGLSSALRGQRHVWDMTFAVGGQAGVRELESGPFDVVLTDMRMPVVDGAAVLARAKELQPRTARIVLSGQTDREAAMRTAFAAHQFLAKPCELHTIRNIIDRTCRLSSLVQDERLRGLAGDVSTLPPAPGIFLVLTRTLADPKASVADAARIVESDPALSAKLLQVVNSAFFGLPRRVTNVREAATLVGTLTLKNLALALDGVKPGKASRHSPAALEALRLHSLHTALVARSIAKSLRANADDAFVAGMLHDVGALLLPADQPVTADHAGLGAYLLGLWGLPHSVVEAVANHHAPGAVERMTDQVPEVADVVAWAEKLTQPYHTVPVLDHPAPGPDRGFPGLNPGQIAEFEGMAKHIFDQGFQ